MKRTLGLLLLAGTAFAPLGCRHPCYRPGFAAQPAPRPVIVSPAPVAPGSGLQPAGAFPVVPPGPVPNPPPGAQIGPPGQAPSISKSPTQPKESAEPPIKKESNRNVPPRIRLYAPEPVDAGKKPASLPPIPQFAQAKANVYAGLRPPLDGLEWLHKNDVRTVVQLRLFGEDDSADRKQVESLKMQYIAFEISPVTLTKEKADDFVKLIRDGAKQGIFVYDRDGSLAGAMWYLYFRRGEFLDDDAAQLRATQLGLHLNGDGPHRDMWLAARKLANAD